MADASQKSGTFAKAFQKRVVRTKEKVLQNLGKADKTTDEDFEQNVELFNKQQTVANKVGKEFKNYLTHSKAMSQAAQGLYAAIKEAYEDDWSGYTQILSGIEALALMHDNFKTTLDDQILASINKYTEQFPEVRSRISKRGRKLVDYDIARHNLQSMEMAKKRDEMKIQKARDDMNDTRNIYEGMNTELVQELAALYDSRQGFTSSVLQQLFNAEGKFNEECSKVQFNMAEVSGRLEKEYENMIRNRSRYERRSPGEPKSVSSEASAHRQFSSDSDSMGRKSASRQESEHLQSPHSGPYNGETIATKASLAEPEEWSSPVSTKHDQHQRHRADKNELAQASGHSPAGHNVHKVDSDDSDHEHRMSASTKVEIRQESIEKHDYVNLEDKLAKKKKVPTATLR